MIHTVDQFIMKGGKMKKLHFGSKNQNAAFNMSFVAEKDTARKALRLNGFAVLRILYFCFSALFSSHFRTPILTY